MTSILIPALTIFGILFAISVIGLFMSNAASSRLHGSDQRFGVGPGMRGSDPQFAEVDRR